MIILPRALPNSTASFHACKSLPCVRASCAAKCWRRAAGQNGSGICTASAQITGRERTTHFVAFVLCFHAIPTFRIRFSNRTAAANRRTRLDTTQTDFWILRGKKEHRETRDLCGPNRDLDSLLRSEKLQRVYKYAHFKLARGQATISDGKGGHIPTGYASRSTVPALRSCHLLRRHRGNNGFQAGSSF